MIFPDIEACARHAGLSTDTDPETIVAHPKVAQKFSDDLGALATRATGSSNHVARAIVMTTPPSIDKGEVTDKGSINQRAVLAARKDIAAQLYDDQIPDGVLDLPRKGK